MTVRALAPEAAGVIGPEFQRPAADSFLGHENAPLEQHLRNSPPDQWKLEIEPDCVRDDLGWEAVTFVADGLDHASPSTQLALMRGLM